MAFPKHVSLHVNLRICCFLENTSYISILLSFLPSLLPSFFGGGGFFFNYSMNFIAFIVVQQPSQPSFIAFPSQTSSLSPPPPNLSHLETISPCQYLFCNEVHCVLFLDSTCRGKHLMLVSHCLTDLT